MIILLIAILLPLAFGDDGWVGSRVLVDGSLPVLMFCMNLFGYLCQSTFMFMLFLLSCCFIPSCLHKRGIFPCLESGCIRRDHPFLAGLLLNNNAAVGCYAVSQQPLC